MQPPIHLNYTKYQKEKKTVPSMKINYIVSTERRCHEKIIHYFFSTYFHAWLFS